MAEEQDRKLDGNAAVNLAAEQSQSTASLNISPEIAGVPALGAPADTANLRLGPNLHDGLLALLPLVGVWRGEGQADSAAGQYAFGQQLTFTHNGENYLAFESIIWRLDSNGEPTGHDQRETGFWRISLDDEISVVSCGAAGVVEIFYGNPLSERAWQLESASTLVTSSGPADLGPGKRLYGLLPTHELGWVEERLVDGALQPRLSAQLKRVVG
ncbi:FABP family protein [Corynebacterium sp.]|uniref:FABP family protein n=1 Tax=Corynebacterium sp. TaxID=1720 RepID=UPI0026DD9375|nr:FABP family protein [Corynebacterium sp.]MDO5076973.1 FABP family protein [Corynebacterium sp.]